MKLLFPTKPDPEHKRQLQYLPSKSGNSSGYKLIALAYDSGQYYAAITDDFNKEMWIERVAKNLGRNSHLCMEDLVKIENEQEWKKVLVFISDRGLLA